MLNYIRGYYTIVIEGLGIERFISNLRKNNISVYNIKKTNKNTIEFRVYKSDIKVLKEIFREGNFEIKIKQKTGIPFLFKRIYKMKITWICALISVFLLLSTSQFVTDIYIQTPEGIKVEELRKEIYKAGLKPGVYKKNVDRKEIRDYIMSKFSEVAYVSINVKGTNIFITVTKKDESLNSKQNSNYCNIIASKNGIIEKVVAKSGKAVVKQGDIVHKGENLVTGAMTKSIPEVWATTFYEASKSENFIETKKVKTGTKKKVYTFVFYDKEFTIRRKIKYKDYIVENSEKKLSLLNYTFPLKIKVSTFFETNNEKVELNKDDLKKSLSQKVIKELEYMIPLSAKIVDVNHDFKVDKNILTYTITVKTSENIAQIYNLDNNEAESIIKNQTGNGDNNQDEEETPSNPEKRPINDIRNKFEPEKKEEDTQQ